MTPPTWVTSEVRDRLGNSVVVFVGIGDVAGYVRKRLEEAIADVGSIGNVRLVSPFIESNWTSSPWAAILGDIEPRYRFAQSADEFLDRLAAAYVVVLLADINAGFVDDPATASSLAAATNGLKKHDALTLLKWIRHAAVVPKPGHAVLAERATAEGLVALGHLVGDDFTIERDGLIVSPRGCYHLLIAIGIQPTSRLRREAKNRLERHLNDGMRPNEAPTFVGAGGLQWPQNRETLPADVVDQGDVDDMVGGALNLTPRFLTFEEALPT
jgi:hypothetical protein